MKRALIHLGILLAISYVFGSIAAWLFIIASLLLTYTARGRMISAKVKQRFLMWKYMTLHPWFKAHQNSWFFKSIERAPWFPWYGRRVVYVKPKDPSKLSDNQRAVKEAITAGDYQKALDIVNKMPNTKQTLALKQVIEAKLN